MDLIIKNLERLKDYSDGNHRPIERVVVDFDKLATEDFAQLFFNACEKYDEDVESYYVETCSNCKYHNLFAYEEPCNSCIESKEINTKWEPNEPTLKEATERMQSEFDATGIDTKIFMNGRVIKR